MERKARGRDGDAEAIFVQTRDCLSELRDFLGSRATNETLPALAYEGEGVVGALGWVGISLTPDLVAGIAVVDDARIRRVPFEVDVSKRKFLEECYPGSFNPQVVPLCVRRFRFMPRASS